MGLRKHHYEQSYWRWWNSSWAISNPKRWCESAAVNMLANLENSAVATGLEKISFHSNTKERQCQRIFKLPHNWLISHTSKVMLKILQVRLQLYVNWELPGVQAGLRKDRGTRNQIANITWIIKKQENSRKTSTSASLTMWKPFAVWITTNCGKFLKRWENHTILLPLEKPVCRSRSNS